MSNAITIREIKSIDMTGGCVIDGFPSSGGLASAIATESLISTTSQFELVGVLDSDLLPPVSIVREEEPNFPARILVNPNLKVAIFSSYLTPDESLYSAAVKSEDDAPFVIGVRSTDDTKKRLQDANIPMLKNGTIPGIPGILLNEGAVTNTNVIVLLYRGREIGPDFRAGAEICTVMSKLIPGASCDLNTLLSEAEIIEQHLKQTERDTNPLRDTIYG